MEYEVLQTRRFSRWLFDLRDVQARAKIARRINRMKRGNFGDHHSVGDGLSEMRVDHGPGYRVYFVRRKLVCVILLVGGDKGSQSRDIKEAKKLAQEVDLGS